MVMTMHGLYPERRIGLGFLRNVCPDQHTTRTFEIPACGSMLLADRTDEHLAILQKAKRPSSSRPLKS